MNEQTGWGARTGVAASSWRAVSRRSTLALCAATGLVLGVPPAGATVVNVANGHSITVMHNIDFVVLAGYEPGDELFVEVIRDGNTIGSARGPADGTGGLEVNHGVAGAAGPGDCFDGHTPDIQPADQISVTYPGGVDKVDVDDLRFTGGPFLERVADGTDDVVVRGIAKRADGTPIAPSGLNQAEFRDGSAFRGTPDVVAATPGVEGGFTMRYHAPYAFARTDGRDERARQDSLLGEGHTIGFSSGEVPSKEVMLHDGITDAPTAALGCEGSPAAVDAVSTTTPQHVNIAARDAGGNLVINGSAFDAEAVHVTLDDADAVSNDVVTVEGVLSPAAGAEATHQSWRASVPMSALTDPALAEGELRISAVMDRITQRGDPSATPTATIQESRPVPGRPLTILKDLTAPAAPTASPAGGSYEGPQSVTLRAADEAADVVRHVLGAPDGAPPTANSPRTTGPVSITTTQTLKAASYDAVGNASAPLVATYTITAPPPPPPPPAPPANTGGSTTNPPASSGGGTTNPPAADSGGGTSNPPASTGGGTTSASASTGGTTNAPASTGSSTTNAPAGTGGSTTVAGTSGGAATAPTAGASPTSTACSTPASATLDQSTITATGAAEATMAGAPGSTVELLAYSRPSSTYRVVRTVVLGASGLSVVRLTPPTNTRLYAQQAGCAPSASSVLNVRTQLSMDVVRNGSRSYTFSGRALPARPGGLVVTLYRVTSDGAQILTAQTRANASSGAYSMPRRFTGSGRFGFVVRTGQDLQNAPGTSNVRSLLVF